VLARVEEVVMSLEYLKGSSLELINTPLREDYPEFMKWLDAKEAHRKIIQSRSRARRVETLNYLIELHKDDEHPLLVQLKYAVLHHEKLFSLSTIHEICEKVDEVCGE